MSNALSKTKSAIAVPAELLKDFEVARKYRDAAKSGMLQAAGFMVLLGFELLRLKKNLGETRGRKKTRSDRVFNWGELVEAALGFTDDTAAKYMLMAQAAKARMKVLQDLEARLLTTPLHALPPADRKRVEDAVKKITDGNTARGFMEECGIARRQKGTFSKQHKGGTSTKSKTTPEEDAQDIFGHLLRTIKDISDPWHTFELRLYAMPLDCTEEDIEAGRISLTDVKHHLEGLLAHVDKAITSTAKHARKSATTDPKARQKEASSQAHAEASKRS